MPKLFELYAQVLSELRRRDVVRSTDNPIADYAEFLCKKAFSAELVHKSTRGFDAIGPDGTKYEVKARRMTSHNTSRELSALRNLDEARFDFLLGVLFDWNFQVLKACQIPHAIVIESAVYSKHTNAWRFQLRNDLWGVSGVIDLTSQLKLLQFGSPSPS